MRAKRIRIGDVLIEAGVLTTEQLSKALEIQGAASAGVRQKRKRLGKILVELNYISEEQLATALSVQINVPRVDLPSLDIANPIIDLIPREIAEAHVLMPYAKEGRRLMVAMSDPLNFTAIDDLRFRTGLEVVAAVTTESSILSAIEKYYRVEETVEDILRLGSDSPEVEFMKESDEEGEAPQTLQQLGQTAPIVKLVTTIIMDAVKRRATDIHLEPRESHLQVRYRVDGNLHDAVKLPKRVQASVVSRVKILGSMDIANRMSPQDGSTKMRYEKKQLDLRISTLPAIFGEKVVIRILDSSSGLLPLAQLGVPELLIKRLQEAGSKSQGMIIATGPTGSGKTTTLYAFLQWLQDPAINIITVEDPVEYTIPGITQVAVREQSGLGFPAFMRSALRQDPDIILVGEIRDLDTAEIAIRAALTGHLVVTTLHTNDTVASVYRLLDLGVAPFLVSSSVSGIIAQRLVRRICPSCKTKIQISDEDLPPEFGHLSHHYKGRGCGDCDYTGYRGQIGVYEYLDVDVHIRRLIANGTSEVALREEAVKRGMTPLFQDALRKVADGITTIAEVVGKVPYYVCGPGSSTTTRVPPERTEANELQARVVVVGAHPKEADWLQATLTSAGYAPTVAGWLDAYEIVCKEKPDAIILDLDKPGGNAAALTERLQSSLSTVTIPVLALLSEDNQAQMGSLRTGVVGLLRKPLQSEQLVRLLDETLNQPV
jgi:type IV pilus assembly protein PilB